MKNPVGIVMSASFVPQRYQCVELGGAEAKRVFAAMMDMGKNDVAKIEAARRG